MIGLKFSFLSITVVSYRHFLNPIIIHRKIVRYIDFFYFHLFLEDNLKYAQY